MIFTETELKDAFIIDIEKREDERGFFSRSFCINEFKQHNIDFSIVQANISTTKNKHTLRGMHYQIDDAQEAKLVRCTKGSILDVIIDIRPYSTTYCNYFQIELNASNYRQLFIPKGFAHGFITLENDVEMQYFVSNFYAPGKEKGIRWNDPLFNIPWPTNKPFLSDKDKNYLDFKK